MDKQQGLIGYYAFWLVLGLFQLIAVSGCSGSNASEANPSSNLSENSSSSSSADSQNVRLSRAFFEKSLAGKMQIVPADGSASTEIDSDVSWREEMPALREPGQMAADHPGCATFNQAGARLCFNIMSDVTSVGVNADETTAPNLGRAAAEAAPEGCNAPIQNIRFVHAEQNDGFLKVSFMGDRPAQENCQAGRLLINLELRQI